MLIGTIVLRLTRSSLFDKHATLERIYVVNSPLHDWMAINNLALKSIPQT